MNKTALLIFSLLIFSCSILSAQDSLPQIGIMKDSINTIELKKSPADFEMKTVAWLKSLTDENTTVTESMLDSMITLNGDTIIYKGFKVKACQHKSTGKYKYFNMEYVMVITKEGKGYSVTFDLPKFYTLEMQAWRFTYGNFFDLLKGGVKPPYKKTVPGVNAFLNNLVAEHYKAIH